jgi:hypothetical protein
VGLTAPTESIRFLLSQHIIMLQETGSSQAGHVLQQLLPQHVIYNTQHPRHGRGRGCAVAISKELKVHSHTEHHSMQMIHLQISRALPSNPSSMLHVINCYLPPAGSTQHTVSLTCQVSVI